jgi:hypothetical protein
VGTAKGRVLERERQEAKSGLGWSGRSGHPRLPPMSGPDLDSGAGSEIL